MGDDKGAAPPARKGTSSVLKRAMTSPAMTSPSLTTSLNKMPFKLLELKVIAAHDLPPVSKYLHTYVMAWVHPENKMITPVDHKGNTNPMWNFRMVFGVDDKFLNSESSAVLVEIYNISKLSNKPIGTTCLPVEILLNNPHSEIMKKPLKLPISRPSGDLRGYLFVSINLVNTTIRNLNEETEASPRTIMIRQISQRLSHAESAKRVTYDEDEEEEQETDDVTTLGDEESDQESEPIEIEIKSLASDFSATLKDSVTYSPSSNGENVGSGISEFGNSWREGEDQNNNENNNENINNNNNENNNENINNNNNENNDNNNENNNEYNHIENNNEYNHNENNNEYNHNENNEYSHNENNNEHNNEHNHNENNNEHNHNKNNEYNHNENNNEHNHNKNNNEHNHNEHNHNENNDEYNHNEHNRNENNNEHNHNEYNHNEYNHNENNEYNHNENNNEYNHYQNNNEKTNNVVESGEDKILIKEDEPKGQKGSNSSKGLKSSKSSKGPKLRSRHRRHSDGGGLLSFFTTAIMCGSGTMGNKHMNKLKKKSNSTKRAQSNDMEIPPDHKKLPHDI